MRRRKVFLTILASLLTVSIARADGETPRYTPNDPLFHAQWNMDSKTSAVLDPDIDALEAWAHYRANAPAPQTCSSDTESHAKGEHCIEGLSRKLVWVGIIGSGVRPYHPDYAGRLYNPGEDIDGNHVTNENDRDFIDNDGNGKTDDIFGLSLPNYSSEVDRGEVARSMGSVGVMGAHADDLQGIAGLNGFGSEMRFLVCPVENGFPADGYFRTCIDYLLDLKTRGVDVVALAANGYYPYPSTSLEDAISQAAASGLLIVNGVRYNLNLAGSGVSIDEVPSYPSSFPADNLLTVGISDESGALSRYSDFGPGTVDLAAPGQRILQPDGSAKGFCKTEQPDFVCGYGIYSGGHLSAAHVAGTAALLWSYDPWLRVDDPDPDGDGPFTSYRSFMKLKDHILNSVKPASFLQGKTASGGLLSAYRALLASDDAQLPRASFSRTCDEVELTCSFLAENRSTFDGVLDFEWDFGDGSVGNGDSTTHTFSDVGTYTVRLTATDAAGRIWRTWRSHAFPESRPEFSAGLIRSGEPVDDAVSYYRTWVIFVPAHRARLLITLEGTDPRGCGRFLGCLPLVKTCDSAFEPCPEREDIDLLVRQGALPDVDTFDCAAAGPEENEVCDIASPQPGWWYIKILGSDWDDTSYRLTATYS